MRFELVPKETFFFRDARPFDRGEGWATGIFPPLPSTVYGALRSAALSRSGIRYSDFLAKMGPEAFHLDMGCPSALGKFAIRSITLFNDNGPLVPMPLDLRRRGRNDLIRFVPNNDQGVVAGTTLGLLKPDQADDDEDTVSKWLDRYALTKYLHGEKRLDGAADQRERYLLEPKTGIEISKKSGVAEDHMLYFQEMIRLRDDYHISVEAENANVLEDRGALKLGHDGRLFSYEKHESFNFDFLEANLKADFISAMSSNGNRFVVLFTSPALLAGGWIPGAKGWDGKGNCPDKNPLKIEIESAVIGRPMPVGGWNIAGAGKGPKAMRKAVPPGSVYRCTLKDGDPEILFERCFNKNLSDVDEDAPKQGFGHMLLGISPES